MPPIFPQNPSRALLLRIGLPAVGLLLALALWAWLGRLPFFPLSPYDALPDGTALWADLPKGADLDSLAAPPGLDSLADSDWASLLRPEALAALRQAPALCALRPMAGQRFGLLHIARAALPDSLARSGSAQAWSNFRGQRILHLRAGAAQGYVCRYRGLLLYASEALPIEDAILQLGRPHRSYARRAGLRALRRASGPGPQWLLHPPALETLLFQDLREAARREVADWGQLLEYAAWRMGRSGGQWEAEAELLPGTWPLLRAAALPAAAAPRRIAGILPANVALAAAFSFEDGRAFFRRAKASDAFVQHVLPHLAHEMVIFSTEASSLEPSAFQFVALQCRDAAAADSALAQLARSLGFLERHEHLAQPVVQLLGEGLLRHLMPSPRPNPYAAAVDEYLIFGQNLPELQRVLEQQIAQATLGRDEAFLRFEAAQGQAPAGSAVYLLANADRLLPLWKTLLRDERDATALHDRFGQGRWVLAWARRQGEGHFRLSLRAELPPRSGPQATRFLWKSSLPRPIIGQAHASPDPATGTHDILVQDSALVLHRLSASGRLLQSIPLDGPILSDIYSIDFHQNGQRQWLFNTATAIHCLDERGQPVGNFPIPLRSPASNGVLLFDLDGQRNYRLIVACENGRVYGFDKAGRALDGWGLSIVGRFAQPFQHVLAQGKDHIFALDEAGRLHDMDLLGNPHFAPLACAPARSVQVLAEGPTFRFVLPLPDGRCKVVGATGAAFHLRLLPEKAAQGAGPPCLLLADLDGDGQRDYLYQKGGTWAAYHYDAAQRFERLAGGQWPAPLDALGLWAAQPLRFWGSRRDVAQSFLFDAGGLLLPDFPVAGHSPLRIGAAASAQPLLLSVEGRTLYAYKVQ